GGPWSPAAPDHQGPARPSPRRRAHPRAPGPIRGAPRMRTPLCEQLGMTLPLFAFTRSPEVVVAVSRAGGMGIQAAFGFTPDELRRCLAYIDAHVDGRPYGVDVVMPSGFVQPDGSHGGAMAPAEYYPRALPAAQVRFLDELLARYEVPPLPPDASAAL